MQPLRIVVARRVLVLDLDHLARAGEARLGRAHERRGDAGPLVLDVRDHEPPVAAALLAPRRLIGGGAHADTLATPPRQVQHAVGAGAVVAHLQAVHHIAHRRALVHAPRRQLLLERLRV